MIKKIAFIITSFGFVLNGFSQTVLFEESFTTGLPETWTLIDSDELIPADGMEAFTAAWIPFITEMDTCMASTSFYNPIGQSQDYLISPKIELGTLSRFIWSAKSYDASYPDSYVVLLSTTDSLEASFTDTLKSVTNETPFWTTHSINLSDAGYSNQAVFIAIKNITNDGFILLVDNVMVLGSEFAAIEDNNNEVALTIYPNPTQNYLNIQSQLPVIGVRIYTLDGRLRINTNDKVLDVSAFEIGIYIIQVETNDGLFSEQFTKN
ncbi:choice-of-anchor J domain-containing protein [Crocinitomix sp.]|nr:choice-of-anchor J domain-containing protein [Crocinitomix sp.]